MQAHARARTHANTHARTHAHQHARTHARTHAHSAHARTHTHTRASVRTYTWYLATPTRLAAISNEPVVVLGVEVRAMRQQQPDDPVPPRPRRRVQSRAPAAQHTLLQHQCGMLCPLRPHPTAACAEPCPRRPCDVFRSHDTPRGAGPFCYGCDIPHGMVPQLLQRIIVPHTHSVRDGVAPDPRPSLAFTPAPCVRRARDISAWPAATASCSGVFLRRAA